MGRKNKGNYWSNVAPKPRGFTFVKGELMTYIYEIPILTNALGQNSWNKTTIDRIFIKVRIKSVTELGFGGIDIDKEYTTESIQKEVGQGVQFEYDDHSFMRDGRMFPFVTSVTIYLDYVDKYRQHRLLKARKEKLEKLKNKMK